MNKIFAFLLGLVIAAASLQPAIAQQAQSTPPARLPGAVPYDFPGQWVFLGDADGGQDSIVAYYYDRARTRRAGSIVATVWVGIDEKNIDAIRTNLYETEFDCAMNRARFVRVQNYDAAHYPVATHPDDTRDWQALASGSLLGEIGTVVCRGEAQPNSSVSNLQASALDAIRARRAKLAASASLGSAFVGRWTDRGNCNTATTFNADGRFEGALVGSGTWALIGDELRMSYPDRPMLTMRLSVIDRDTLEVTQKDGSTARSVRCPNASTNASAPGGNFASSGEAQAVLVNSGNGTSFTYRGSEPPVAVPVRVTSEGQCLTTYAYAMPERRENGAVKPAGDWAIVTDWTKVTAADQATTGDPAFIDISLAGRGKTHAIYAVRDHQRALAAAQYLISRCASGGQPVAPVIPPSPADQPSSQAAGSREPASIADAQRQFAAAVDGAAYPIGEGNPPGQWRALETITPCVSRFRLLMPARTTNGRAWPQSSSDYEASWTRILTVETVPGSPYVRLATAANPTFGFHVRPGEQPVAAAAARYLISHCATSAGAAAPAQSAATSVLPQSSDFAVRWGPYATLAQHGWWRRTDGAYWHYSWITPGQELRAEYFSANGQRAWNLKYRIESGALMSDQLPPQPIRSVSATSIEHGQNDRITLLENGQRMAYHSGDQDSSYLAAQPPSFAQNQTPNSGSRTAGSASSQAAAASTSPLLLHWTDGGRWRPNRVWQTWDAGGVSTTLRTSSGPLRHQITFIAQICNTSGQVWRGVAAFYENRELSPTTLNLQPGECGEIQRTQLNGEYQVFVSLTRL